MVVLHLCNARQDVELLLHCIAFWFTAATAVAVTVAAVRCELICRVSSRVITRKRRLAALTTLAFIGWFDLFFNH